MHVPVLLQEVIDGLTLTHGDTVVDATVGGGGYTRALCEQVGKNGVVVGFDQDGDAIARAKEALADVSCTLRLIHANFRMMDAELAKLGVEEIQGAAFDLGFSSMQIEDSGRGFSFLSDEPLLMTLSNRPEAVPFTARDIINSWSEEDIANVIFGYGEERYARRIARGIVAARQHQPIETAQQLVAVIKDVVPGRYRTGAIHPATRTFQALRIAVNDELNALKEGLEKAFTLLAPGKRLAVVSFHSLEDRIVKEFSKEKEKEGAMRITKKPIIPSDDEIQTNPRSRSAKLRIIQK